MSIERDNFHGQTTKPFLFVHHDHGQGQTGKDKRRSEEIKQHLAQRQRKPRERKKLEIHPSIGQILGSDLSRDADDQDEASYEPMPGRTSSQSPHFTEQLAPFKVSRWKPGSPGSAASPGVVHAASNVAKSRDTLVSSDHAFNTFGHCWHDEDELEQSDDEDDEYYNASLPSPFMLKAVNAGLFDPLTPLQGSSDEIGPLMQLYNRRLRPLAKVISPHWEWVGDLSLIRSSPMLTFAIAAYASAFVAGMEQGSRGVCLPPIPNRDEESLWPIPQWFRFQAQALTFLKRALAEEHSLGQPEIFHTMLFLFRLAVLLGDGPMGQIHLSALRQAFIERGNSVENLSRELAVVKANFINVYQYKNAMLKIRCDPDAGGHPHYYIYPDKAYWGNEHEWNKFKADMFCRNLTWHANSIGKIILEESQVNILHLDRATAQLSAETFEDLVKAYQVALFLWSYLNNINFDPATSRVQVCVDELQQYLQHVGLENLKLYAPKLTIMFLFVCAYASRGWSKRKTFISLLVRLDFHPIHMRDLYAELEQWCNPVQVQPKLLEEMLIEIRRANEGNRPYSHEDLYQGEYYRHNFERTPMSKSPDLETPLRELQLQP